MYYVIVHFLRTQLNYFSLLTTDNKATEKRSEDLTQRVVISNDKKSEEYAIIAPNGAPILASSVPGTFFLVCIKPYPFNQFFSARNFLSTLLNCFDLQHKF